MTLSHRIISWLAWRPVYRRWVLVHYINDVTGERRAVQS